MMRASGSLMLTRLFGDLAAFNLCNFANSSIACELAGEAHATGQPENRELQLLLAFESAMAKKIRVDDAVGQRKVEQRRE
jgi:hypothetical protein